MKVVIFVLFINASATIINIVYLFTVDKKMLKKKFRRQQNYEKVISFCQLFLLIKIDI